MIHIQILFFALIIEKQEVTAIFKWKLSLQNESDNLEQWRKKSHTYGSEPNTTKL